MFIMISTAFQENYGEADAPHWKAKGGSEYLVEVELARILEAEDKALFLKHIVERVTPQVTCDNDMCREWIRGWELVEDDYLTYDELDQLEFDGSISSWAPLIEIPPSKPQTLSRTLADLGIRMS